MSKKSPKRSPADRHASFTAGKKIRDRNEAVGVNAEHETPARPDFHPPRKNVPMLIVSSVLLIAWLIVMLAIAVVS